MVLSNVWRSRLWSNIIFLFLSFSFSFSFSFSYSFFFFFFFFSFSFFFLFFFFFLFLFLFLLFIFILVFHVLHFIHSKLIAMWLALKMERPYGTIFVKSFLKLFHIQKHSSTMSLTTNISFLKDSNNLTSKYRNKKLPNKVFRFKKSQKT